MLARSYCQNASEVNQQETPGRDGPKPELVLTKCRNVAGAVQDGSWGAFAPEAAQWLGQLVEVQVWQLSCVALQAETLALHQASYRKQHPKMHCGLAIRRFDSFCALFLRVSSTASSGFAYGTGTYVGALSCW